MGCSGVCAAENAKGGIKGTYEEPAGVLECLLGRPNEHGSFNHLSAIAGALLHNLIGDGVIFPY